MLLLSTLGSKSGKRWNSRDLPNPVGKQLKRPDHSAKNRNIALVLVFKKNHRRNFYPNWTNLQLSPFFKYFLQTDSPKCLMRNKNVSFTLPRRIQKLGRQDSRNMGARLKSPIFWGILTGRSQGLFAAFPATRKAICPGNEVAFSQLLICCEEEYLEKLITLKS